MVTTARRHSRGQYAFIGAAGVLGLVHAGFSFYWSAGGTFLLQSVGTDLAATFDGRGWLLAAVAAIKLIAALAPLAFALSSWPAGWVTRGVCWLGAAILVVWGGLNTVAANLVLAGAINSGAGFDRAGMVGHAYLWDPLFLAWGLALMAGLLTGRAAKTKPANRSVN